MKNLIVFIGPDKKLFGEYVYLMEIQIENALRLGWKPEDILFVTDFPYEYMGVKSILTKSSHYCAVRPRSIKTSIIPSLIDEGILQDGEVYWNHDTDVFQLVPIVAEELEMDTFDLGLTDYGWRPRYCLGSYFFTTKARDIFEPTSKLIFQDIEDEDAIQTVLDSNPDMAARTKRMNITYNLGMRRVPENVERATKPIRTLAFHPRKPGLMEIFKPLMPVGLVEIFAKHGFT